MWSRTSQQITSGNVTVVLLTTKVILSRSLESGTPLELKHVEDGAAVGNHICIIY